MMFNIGDKVRPSSKCRSLYGDPDVMTIVDIRQSLSTRSYITDVYPKILFEEYELERVHEIINAEQSLTREEAIMSAKQALEELYTVKDLYTREEVYLIAQRSVHAVINNILTNNYKSVEQIINSEIDTVKLF